MEQPTVIRYVIAVTVDIQAAFEDVLVCHVILMAQFLPSASTVLYWTRRLLSCVPCPCSSSGLNATLSFFVNNNNNNNSLTTRPLSHTIYHCCFTSCTWSCWRRPRYRLDSAGARLLRWSGCTRSRTRDTAGSRAPAACSSPSRAARSATSSSRRSRPRAAPGSTPRRSCSPASGTRICTDPSSPRRHNSLSLTTDLMHKCWGQEVAIFRQRKLCVYSASVQCCPYILSKWIFSPKFCFLNKIFGQKISDMLNPTATMPSSNRITLFRNISNHHYH